MERETYIDLFKHMNEKAVDTSNLFLRSAILINGGAAVAVLGFVAAIAKADQAFTETIVGVAGAISYFALGAAAGVICIAIAYLTHYATLATLDQTGGARKEVFGNIKRFVHVCAILVATASVAFFLLGVLEVKSAILIGLV
ncbi:hypothetical protein [Ponticoccus litoralis]|uniref:Uncharacterized protein n=1 Tax=Ponticoccus litoralis TaxID=422297 RepID=A0AAW9SGU7_9RHOB